MTKSTKQLSWNAVRIGDRYCAPACGRGCTWQEYNDAMALAQSTIRAMKSGEWESTVHENLGWHASVRSKSGYLSLGIHKYGATVTYTPRLSHEPDGVCTPMEWHVGDSFSDPNDAVAAQLAVVRRYKEQSDLVYAAVISVMPKGAQ